MRALVIGLAVVVASLFAARGIDFALGLADGTTTYFVVAPLLLLAGLYAAYRAHLQIRQRREGPWPDAGIGGPFDAKGSCDAADPTHDVGSGDVGGDGGVDGGGHGGGD
jgi:hypothetical protein